MRKIYLAISSKEELAIIYNELEKRNIELKVEELSHINDINNALTQPFDLLIVDHHYIPNMESIDTSHVEGMIWYVNSRLNEQMAENGEVVSYFNTYSKVRIKLIHHSYANPDITHQIQRKHISKPKKEVVEHSDKDQGNHIDNTKEIDPVVDRSKQNDNDQGIEKPKIIDNDKGIEKLKINDKDTTDQDNGEGEAYQSFENPPYPEIEEKVLKKIKADSNKVKSPIIKHNESEDTATTEDSKSQKEYESLLKRAAKLSEDVFLNDVYEGNKTIGIWAPLHQAGVTTFVMNLAIYFGRMNIPTTVVEGVTKSQLIKNELQRFHKKPHQWSSFIKAMHDDSVLPEQLRWTYRGVQWLPLDAKDDMKYEWNKLYIKLLMNHAKSLNKLRPFNQVFVDLPTGNMAQSTLDILEHLDELWIILPTFEQTLLTWKGYIADLLKSYNLKGELIFKREIILDGTDMKRKRVNRIAKTLNLPVLADLPHLQGDFEDHTPHSKPFIEHGDVMLHFQAPFDDIGKELLGKNYRKDNPSPIITKFRTLFQSKT